jgi:hypothetical protein
MYVILKVSLKTMCPLSDQHELLSLLLQLDQTFCYTSLCAHKQLIPLSCLLDLAHNLFFKHFECFLPQGIPFHLCTLCLCALSISVHAPSLACSFPVSLTSTDCIVQAKLPCPLASNGFGQWDDPAGDTNP